MTKKNLRPQQTAPIQRETNTTSSVAATATLTPQFYFVGTPPFASDDAE